MLDLPGLGERVLQALLRGDGREVDGRSARGVDPDLPGGRILEVLLHDDAREAPRRDDNEAVRAGLEARAPRRGEGEDGEGDLLEVHYRTGWDMGP